MKVFALCSILFLSCFFNSAFGATITSGAGVSSSAVLGNVNLAQAGGTIQAITDYNIFVDGDLYLDYSVFSANQNLFVGSNIKLIANAITIFAFNDAVTMPDLSDVSVFTTIPDSLNEVGSFVFFSAAPVLNGTFEATGSLFVGNYVSLQAVPLPATAILFLSGLFMLGGVGVKKHLNRCVTRVEY